MTKSWGFSVPLLPIHYIYISPGPDLLGSGSGDYHHVYLLISHVTLIFSHSEWLKAKVILCPCCLHIVYVYIPPVSNLLGTDLLCSGGGKYDHVHLLISHVTLMFCNFWMTEGRGHSKPLLPIYCLCLHLPLSLIYYVAVVMNMTVSIYSFHM